MKHSDSCLAHLRPRQGPRLEATLVSSVRATALEADGAESIMCSSRALSKDVVPTLTG